MSSSNILNLLGLGGSNGLIHIGLGGQSNQHSQTSGSSHGNSNGHQPQNGGSSVSHNVQPNGGLLNVAIGGGNGDKNPGSSSQSGSNAFYKL